MGFFFINIWSFRMFWDGLMGGGQLDGFGDSRGGWIGRTSTPLWDICLAVSLYPEQKGGRVSDWAGSQRHNKLPVAGNRKAGWKNRFQLLDQRLPRSKFSKNTCREKKVKGELRQTCYVTCRGTVLQNLKFCKRPLASVFSQGIVCP